MVSNTLGLCLSDYTTLRMVDDMGSQHDQRVVQWARLLEVRIDDTGIEVHKHYIFSGDVY